MLFGNRVRGPTWGDSHDLEMKDNYENKDNESRQSSFNYKGRENALSGAREFQAEDYETYQLILE